MQCDNCGKTSCGILGFDTLTCCLCLNTGINCRLCDDFLDRDYEDMYFIPFESDYD